MKCATAEKLISDALDGMLPEKKKRRLEAHLAGCPGCRAYQARQAGIQGLGRSLDRPSPSAEYLEHLSRSLEARIRTQGHGADRRPRLRFSPRWALAGASALAALALAMVIFRGPTKEPLPEVFSFESLVSRLELEVGPDAETAAEFSSLISGEVGEDLVFAFPATEPQFGEEGLFWETLNEEELFLLAEALQSELKS